MSYPSIRLLWLPALVAGISLLPSIPAFADLPVFDMGNVPAYRQALLASKDPAAATLLKEIANGPADYTKAKSLAIADGIETETDAKAPPDDQNAAPLYEKWVAMIKASNSHMPLYGDPMTLKYQYTPDQVAAIKSYLADTSASDTVLTAALEKPSLYFPPDRSDPAGGSFPDLASLRGAARTIYTEAALQAYQGNASGAINIQLKGLKLERQIAQIHGVIPYLVDVAIDAIDLSGLQSILTHSAPNAALAIQVMTEVQKSESIVSVKTEMAGEGKMLCRLHRLYSSAIMQSPSTSAGGQPGISADDKVFCQDLIDASFARSFDMLREDVDILGDPPDVRRTETLAFAKKCDIVKTEFPQDLIVPPTVDSDGTGPLSRADGMLARAEVLRIGAMVLAIKAATGTYPPAISDGVVDPYSGRPLKYVVTDKGFVVYSVGPSGMFNGLTQPAKGWDSSFVYPAPPAIPVPDEMLQNGK